MFVYYGIVLFTFGIFGVVFFLWPGVGVGVELYFGVGGWGKGGVCLQLNDDHVCVTKIK